MSQIAGGKKLVILMEGRTGGGRGGEEEGGGEGEGSGICMLIQSWGCMLNQLLKEDE